MDWCVFLGFSEAGLEMAELILFTIHRKIRPYIPWRKIKEQMENHRYSLRTYLNASLRATTMMSDYAWRLGGNRAHWVNIYHKRLFH